MTFTRRLTTALMVCLWHIGIMCRCSGPCDRISVSLGTQLSAQRRVPASSLLRVNVAVNQSLRVHFNAAIWWESLGNILAKAEAGCWVLKTQACNEPPEWTALAKTFPLTRHATLTFRSWRSWGSFISFLTNHMIIILCLKRKMVRKEQ